MPSCRASFIPQRASRPHLVSSLAKRGCFHYRKWRTLLCLSFSFILNGLRFFDGWNGPFSDIIRESSNIPRELSSGKFLLINFARSKYFGGEFCLTDKKQFFQLCSGNSDGYVS